jgi:long-subunit fatty acid transport protein
VTVLDGTGLYAGINGTLNLTAHSAETGPLYSSGSQKGQCNTSNMVVPNALFVTAIGAGTVSFR